ncbi:MAG: TldD/PmbA family protein [bacterium]
MNEKERLDLAEWAMQQALDRGAGEASVVLRSERIVEIEHRDGKLDKLSDAQQNGLELEVYVDKRYSANSTNDLRRDELAKFIEEAVASARYLAQDEYRGLPDPRYYPAEPGGGLRIFDPDYEKVESRDRVKMAQAIEIAIRDAGGAGDRIISATGSYSDSRIEMVRVHSNGFVGGLRATRFDVSADVTIRDGAGGRLDDWSGATTRFYGDLAVPLYLGEEAVERAVAKIGQKKIASGEYDLLVENRAGRRLVRMLQEPLGGRALQQKTSFLDGMMHKRVGSDKLTVIDDPTVPKGLGSRIFDGEGLVARVMPVFEEGTLRNYYVDVYYGRKLGMEPTTAWPSNLVFSGGERPLEEMVRDVKRGILVQGFIGGNSNSTTGDFSVGIAGFLVEGGRRTTPVHEMNISGNTRDLFSRLAEVGNDPYRYSSQRTPSMLFEGVQFSGV